MKYRDPVMIIRSTFVPNEQHAAEGKSDANAATVATASPPIERHLHPPQSAAKAQAEIVAEVMDRNPLAAKNVRTTSGRCHLGGKCAFGTGKNRNLRQMLDAGFSPRFARELLAELPRDLNATEALARVKGSADRSFLTINVENDIVTAVASTHWSARPALAKRRPPPSSPRVRAPPWGQQGGAGHHRWLPHWGPRTATDLLAGFSGVSVHLAKRCR